jgi:alpha-1,3-rhamnosyltransferase
MSAQRHDVSDTPLVTVIIASYNHARYIEKSVNSVINQTYSNIELLVIDDGSTDESPTILKQLQEKHGFDLRFQANKGLAATLNDAIGRARGELIVPFGSDDIMVAHRIATQVEYMKGKPEVGICSANIETIDQDGRVMGPREQRKRNLPFRRLDFDDLFLDRKPGPMAATLMLRREPSIKSVALMRTFGWRTSISSWRLLVPATSSTCLARCWRNTVIILPTPSRTAGSWWITC